MLRVCVCDGRYGMSVDEQVAENMKLPHTFLY